MDPSTLFRFEEVLHSKVPIRVTFRNVSLQRFLRLPGTVLFPDRRTYVATPQESFEILAREFVRLWDIQKDGILWVKLKLPQILIVVPLILYVILSSQFGWLLNLPVIGHLIWSFCFLSLGVLAPWPSPWRTEATLRSCGMILAVRQWMGLPAQVEEFLGDFDRICRNPRYVRRKLEATRQQAQFGSLQRIEPYSTVYSFLASQGLVRKA